MQNPNMPPIESVEMMHQAHDPTQAEIAAMNAVAAQQMAESSMQFDTLLNQQLAPTDVETVAKQDFDIQAGAENQVLGIDGSQVSKDGEEKLNLAFQYEELADGEGQRQRINNLARKMHMVTETVLSDYGIEPLTNVGKGGEVAEKVLIAEGVKDMKRAGGAKELDPTGNRAKRVLEQDMGTEAVKFYDQNIGKLRELYEDDPAKAQQVAEAVSIYRLNGSVNYRTTQALGQTLEGGRDTQLPTAA